LGATLFVVIFEGRTGSSELMARLDTHPAIQAFPEILAPLCGMNSTNTERQTAIERFLDSLQSGGTVSSFAAEYSKLRPFADRSRVQNPFEYSE
jgi:hypothetical protein